MVAPQWGRRNALFLSEAGSNKGFNAGTDTAQQVADLPRVMSELTTLMSKAAARLDTVGWEAMFGKEQRLA